MNKKLIVRNIALMVMFGAIGLTQFNENVRIVQIIGLFVCGAGFGAALTTLIYSLKSRQTKT